MTSPLILCSILSIRNDRTEGSGFRTYKNYFQLFASIFLTIQAPKPLIERRFSANLPFELIKKIVMSPSFEESKDALAYLKNLSLISVSFPVQEVRVHYANSGTLIIPSKNLPQFLDPLSKNLYHLSLSNFQNFDVKFTQLTSLSVTRSRITSSVIREISRMPKLKRLNMENCEKILNNSPDFSRSSLVLEELCLKKFKNLECLSDFTMAPLTNLKKLILTSLPLNNLPLFDNLKQLTLLKIANLPIWQLPSFKHLVNLKKFTLYNCPNLTALPSLKYLKNLRSLEVRSCEQITNFPSIKSLISLRKLTILECNNLSKIPEDTELSRLDKVNIHPYHPLPSILPDNEDELFNLYYLIRFLA